MNNFYIEGGIKGDYIVGVDYMNDENYKHTATNSFRTTSTWTHDTEDEFKKSWLKQTCDTDFIFSGRMTDCWKYSSRRKKVLIDKYKKHTLLKNRIIVSLLFAPFTLAIAYGIFTDYIHGFFAGVGAGYCLYKIFTGLTEKWPIENVNHIKDRINGK